MNIKADKIIARQTISLNSDDIRMAIEYWLRNYKKINGEFYNFILKCEQSYDYDVRTNHRAEISIKAVKTKGYE